jgi:hypothetical protein
MSILGKLFGGRQRTETTPAADVPPVECSHMQLVPRWANAEDMGKADKATEYICSACGEHFEPARAHEMRGY